MTLYDLWASGGWHALPWARIMTKPCTECEARQKNGHYLTGVCKECGFSSTESLVLEAAFSGCFDLAGYDISALDKEEQDQIFVAALDALPQGMDAAREASVEVLRSIAVAGGWEEWLEGDENE